MTAYLLGLATLPAAGLSWMLFCLALRGAATATAWTLIRLGVDADRAKRARVASVLFASRRAYLLGVGAVGLVLVVGLRRGEQADAYQALRPGLRVFTKADKS